MKKGFTLIELLVATTLFVTVTVLLIGILIQFLARNISLRKNQSALQSLNFAIDYITREARLSQSYQNDGSPVKVNGVNVYTAFTLRRSNQISSGKSCYRIEGNTLQRSKDEIAVDSLCTIVEAWLPLTSTNLSLVEPLETFPQNNAGDFSYFRVIDSGSAAAQQSIDISLVAEYTEDGTDGELDRKSVTVRTSTTQRLVSYAPSTDPDTNPTLGNSFVLSKSNKDPPAETCCVNEDWKVLPPAVFCDVSFATGPKSLHTSMDALYIVGENYRLYRVDTGDLSQFVDDLAEEVLGGADYNPDTNTTLSSSNYIKRVVGSGHGEIQCPADAQTIQSQDNDDPVRIKSVSASDYTSNVVALSHPHGLYDGFTYRVESASTDAVKISSMVSAAAQSENKTYLVRGINVYSRDTGSTTDIASGVISSVVSRNITDFISTEDGQTQLILSNGDVYLRGQYCNNTTTSKFALFIDDAVVTTIFTYGDIIGYANDNGTIYTCKVGDAVNTTGEESTGFKIRKIIVEDGGIDMRILTTDGEVYKATLDTTEGAKVTVEFPKMNLEVCAVTPVVPVVLKDIAYVDIGSETVMVGITNGAIYIYDDDRTDSGTMTHDYDTEICGGGDIQRKGQNYRIGNPSLVAS